MVGHEIAHSLGPRFVYGTHDTVNIALKDHYSALEELRANVLSVYLQNYLLDKGYIKNRTRESMYTSFMASELRTLRMGHGAYSTAARINFNFINEKGGFVWENDRIKINFKTFGEALNQLSREVSVIEAEGNYERATDLVNKYNITTEFTEPLMQDIPNIPADLWANYKI